MTRWTTGLVLLGVLGGCPGDTGEEGTTREEVAGEGSPHEPSSEPPEQDEEPARDPDCRELTEGLEGDPVPSRRLRRYPSDEYAVDEVWTNVSVRREGDRLRVRWWLEERDCPLATEQVRVGDLVALREARDPSARCMVVGATLVETTIEVRASDRRICVPGRESPKALEDLADLAAPVTRPTPRTLEAVDPWATE